MPQGRLIRSFGWSPNADAIQGPPVVARTLPRGIVSGVTSRSWEMGGEGGAFASRVDSIVIDFEWSYAQDVRGRLRPTFVADMRKKLDYALTRRASHGGPTAVSLRPRLGIWSPDFAMESAGRMPWFTRFGKDGDTSRPDPLTAGYYAIPQGTIRWWVPAFFELADELYRLLALEFGSHPAVVEIDMAFPSTQFMEPFVHQLASLSNLRTMLDAGWTEELDDAAFRAGWDTFNRHWAPLRVGGYCAYNPPGEVVYKDGSPKFRNGNSARAIRVMEGQMAAMGGLAIISNKSLNNVERYDSRDQTPMWDRQVQAHFATPPTLIRYQTETLPKLTLKYDQGGSTVATMELAVAMGATSVEVPVGSHVLDPARPLLYLSPEACADYNARLRANGEGLYTP